jgi:hypothetical protein
MRDFVPLRNAVAEWEAGHMLSLMTGLSGASVPWPMAFRRLE